MRKSTINSPFRLNNNSQKLKSSLRLYNEVKVSLDDEVSDNYKYSTNNSHNLEFNLKQCDNQWYDDMCYENDVQHFDDDDDHNIHQGDYACKQYTSTIKTFCI